MKMDTQNISAHHNYKDEFNNLNKMQLKKKRMKYDRYIKAFIP